MSDDRHTSFQAAIADTEQRIADAVALDMVKALAGVPTLADIVVGDIENWQPRGAIHQEDEC